MRRITREAAAEAVRSFHPARTLGSGMSIVPCGVDDLERVLALGRSVFSYNAPTREEMLYAFTKAHAAVFGLIDKASGNLAGYIFLEAHMGHKNLYINTAAVGEAYRGLGLGRALYELADHFAKALEAGSLWCHTAENNDVNIRLLEQLGYKVTRTEADYYEDGRGALVFRKRTVP